MNQNACLYCGVFPNKAYKYGWKCRDCGNTVHYNSKHTFIYGRTRLTQAEDAVVELFNSAYIFLEATEDDFIAMESALKIRFNLRHVNKSDIVWSLINSTTLLNRTVEIYAKDLKGADETILKKYITSKVETLNMGLKIARDKFNGVTKPY